MHTKNYFFTLFAIVCTRFSVASEQTVIIPNESALRKHMDNKYKEKSRKKLNDQFSSCRPYQ